MTFYFRRIFTVILILQLGASFAMGASVSAEPSGNGVFTIRGNNMDGVAGIDLILSYDTTTLGAPTVTQGSLVSGAMLAANTNNPGSIRIAIISTKTFSGSGPIATVSFATYKGVPDVTISFSNMIDSKGMPVSSGGNPPPAASGFISSPGIPFSQQGSTSTTTVATGSLPTVTTPTTSVPAASAPTSSVPAATAMTTSVPTATTATMTTSVPTYLGTVSMPSDAANKIDTKTADTASVVRQFTEPAAIKQFDPPENKNTVESSVENRQVSDQQKPAIVKTTSYKGTLENFRAYKGEKSPAIYMALFNKTGL